MPDEIQWAACHTLCMWRGPYTARHVRVVSCSCPIHGPGGWIARQRQAGRVCPEWML